MAKVTYKLSAFNATKAKLGTLCIMVSKTLAVTDGVTTITNVTITNGKEVRTADFYGAGICRFTSPNNYTFTINSQSYVFRENGSANSMEAFPYKLVMGDLADEISTTGNSINTSTSSSTTRRPSGDDTEISDTSGQAYVDSLNARDQFAIQALKIMFSRTEQDPSTMDNSQMNFFCQQAYQLAANMMTLSANSRATLDDTTATDIPEQVEVGSLETNTEKILNNIFSALCRTDFQVGSTPQETGTWHNAHAGWEFEDINGTYDDTWVNENLLKIVAGEEVYCTDIADAEANDWGWTATETAIYAERFAFPELMTFLNDYVKHTPQTGEPATKTTVGLDDLIEAIKDISSGGGGSSSVDFTPLITALQGLSTDRGITSMPDVNIGNTGLGRDQAHPIYTAGGGFPSKQLLAAQFVAQDADATKVLTDFLTFNTNGAVGYSTKAEVAKAVLASLTADAIYNKIQANIDTRIQAWLTAARVNVNGTDYPITVNTPTS